MTKNTESQIESGKPGTGKAWQGAFNAYGTAFEGIKQNPKPVLLFVGLYTLLTILGMPTQDGKQYLDPGYNNLADILFLIFLVAFPTYGLAVADKKQLSLREIVRPSFAKFMSVLVASILSGLIVGVSLLLLIIPAIWTIAWLSLYSFAAVDKNMGPVAALKESKRLASEHKAKVWGIIGVGVLMSIGAGIISVIPFVGAAAIAAVSVWVYVAAAILYRWLQKQGTEA
jgi:hypothetical protein